MLLTNYNASRGDASAIVVANVYATAIENVRGRDVADELFAAGILRDDGGGGETTRSTLFGLADEIANALDSFELFDVAAVVEPVASFDATDGEKKLSVSPIETRTERNGRGGILEQRDYSVAWFRTLPNSGVELVDLETGRLERAARRLINGTITTASGVYVVDAATVEPFDAEQLYSNVLFSGVIGVTLTNTLAPL